DEREPSAANRPARQICLRGCRGPQKCARGPADADFAILRGVRPTVRWLVVGGGVFAWARTSLAATGDAGVLGDPIASVILWLALILAAAKIGGHVAARIKQPPVLGELVAGLLLGNLSLFG